jgi:hypothetical protein
MGNRLTNTTVAQGEVVLGWPPHDAPLEWRAPS